MAEFTYAAAQIVANGENVLLTETTITPSRCIVHRDGSGIVTLRGLTNCQSRARFRVGFGANIAHGRDGWTNLCCAGYRR